MRYILFYPVRNALGSWPISAILNRLWERHNIGDGGDEMSRPLAKNERSMCVGDIIYLGKKGIYMVDRIGFTPLEESDLPEIRS